MARALSISPIRGSRWRNRGVSIQPRADAPKRRSRRRGNTTLTRNERTGHNRRDWLARMAAWGAAFQFVEPGAKARTAQDRGVNRNSAPSQLKITDMRVCTIAGVTGLDYPIIRIDTNQAVHGLGEVRDGGVAGWALLLKPHVLGKARSTSSRSWTTCASSPIMAVAAAIAPSIRPCTTSRARSTESPAGVCWARNTATVCGSIATFRNPRIRRSSRRARAPARSRASRSTEWTTCPRPGC